MVCDYITKRSENSPTPYTSHGGECVVTFMYVRTVVCVLYLLTFD